MTRNLMLCAAVALSGLYAQSGGAGKETGGPANPFTSAIIQQFTPVRAYIEQAADAMPAAKYSFQISDVNPYSYWAAHAAFGAHMDCYMISTGGTVAPAPDLIKETQRITTLTDKASLTKEIKAAFQGCADALAGMNDQKALASPRILASMIHLVAHNNEIYGNMVEYLRASGIVPPSTANRARGRGTMKQ